MNRNIDLGETGEKIAVQFLEEKGMKILERNYRFARAEVDIIALDGNELVFVEVKTRKNEAFGNPESSITKRKIQQIKKVAEYFISEKEKELNFDSVRIDAIAIKFLKNSQYEIEHFKNIMFL